MFLQRSVFGASRRGLRIAVLVLYWDRVHQPVSAFERSQVHLFGRTNLVPERSTSSTTDIWAASPRR